MSRRVERETQLSSNGSAGWTVHETRRYIFSLREKITAPQAERGFTAIGAADG
jgi:hypothetical protein